MKYSSTSSAASSSQSLRRDRMRSRRPRVHTTRGVLVDVVGGIIELITPRSDEISTATRAYDTYRVPVDAVVGGVILVELITSSRSDGHASATHAMPGRSSDRDARRRQASTTTSKTPGFRLPARAATGPAARTFRPVPRSLLSAKSSAVGVRSRAAAASHAAQRQPAAYATVGTAVN